MTPPSALPEQVQRFRAGKAYTPSNNPDSAGWLRLILPVLATAAADLANQFDRIDRFSLPLLPTTEPVDRASPEATAKRFLSQLRSDFRRVAFPGLDLAEVEERRLETRWASALSARGIGNRSVAVLAVGQYLAFDEPVHFDLEAHLQPWLDEADRIETGWFETTFGPVIGALVQRALRPTVGQLLPSPPRTVAPSGRPTIRLAHLPEWAHRLDIEWSYRFVSAGAQQLTRSSTQRKRPESDRPLPLKGILGALEFEVRRTVAKHLGVPEADIDFGRVASELERNPKLAGRSDIWWKAWLTSSLTSEMCLSTRERSSWQQHLRGMHCARRVNELLLQAMIRTHRVGSYLSQTR